MDLVVDVELVDRGEGRHRLQILGDGDGCDYEPADG